MASDLDDLMDRDPLEMSNDDISKVIGYYRERRMKMESGERPKRARREEGPKIQFTLADLGLAKPVEPIKKRF